MSLDTLLIYFLLKGLNKTVIFVYFSQTGTFLAILNKSERGCVRTDATPFIYNWKKDNYSLILAHKYSRLRRAILLSEMLLGHSAAQAPVLVQLPKPNSSILATIARARRARST